MSYQPSRAADSDTLMSALTNLACAQAQLHDVTQQLRGYGDEAEASADDKDEPSRGDVAEAEPSDVRASSQLPDNPVALARSMQQKRHGGAS
jgi:hypothetical protein